MEHILKKALCDIKGYGEIRFEETNITNISYQGKEIEESGTSLLSGGNVRVLGKGGWGFATFNDIKDLPKAVKSAQTAGSLFNGTSLKLAPVPVSNSSYVSKPEIDPASISMAEKVDLCGRYNRLILNSPRIQSSVVRYRDKNVKEYLVNTDGAVISQETKFCGIMFSATAIDGMNVQQAYHSAGNLRGYQIVRGLEDKAEEVAKRAVELLSAEPVKAGVYTVVADPKLCGVFVHEAFGHLSEADHIYENEKLKAIMEIGRRFGPDNLTIIDDGTIEGEAGFYAFDSEGTKSSKTYLIKNGILNGRLHSRETAAKMNEAPTGNARALDFSFRPIVRMANTYMQEGDISFEKMISETDCGLYAKGMLGGMTNTEMFTFSSEEAFLIEKGKIEKRVRDVVLTGNVFETLANIDMIGDDKVMYGGMGGCGKGGQSPLRVSDGGPHIRIKNVVIGGQA